MPYMYMYDEVQCTKFRIVSFKKRNKGPEIGSHLHVQRPYHVENEREYSLGKTNIVRDRSFFMG